MLDHLVVQHVLIGAVGYGVYVRRVIRTRLELVFRVILESTVEELNLIRDLTRSARHDRQTILTSDP